MIKVYILEDEIYIQNYIKQILQKISYVKVVGCSKTISKAKTDLQETHADVILADINLEDGNSFDLFNALHIKKYNVIFVTAFSQYAIEAFNIGAIGYILKPFEALELENALEKIYHKNDFYNITTEQFKISSSYFEQKNKPQKLVLKNIDYVQIITFDEILYCEGDSGYVTFFLNDGSKIIVSKGLKEYEYVLYTPNFLRCHQSFIVNMNHVQKYYKEGYLSIKNEIKILVSTRKKDLVLRYFDEWL